MAVLRSSRGRSRSVMIVAVLALWFAAAGIAVAQSSSLEDALGDSLEVRRNGAPIEDVEGDQPAGDADGGGGAGSDGSGGGGTGGAGGDADAGTATSGGTDGADGDGLRDPVAPDAGGSGDGTADGDAPSGDVEGDNDPSEDLELDPGDTGVEGEGRGAGELDSGVDPRGRGLPIAVAVLMVIGSLGAVLSVGRHQFGSAG